MVTIRSLYEQHRAIYGTVPPLGATFSCPVCLGVRDPSFAQCAGCYRGSVAAHSGSGSSGVVVPMSTAFESGDAPQARWYRALHSYKRTAAAFEEHFGSIAAIIGMGLHVHAAEWERRLGGPPDRIVVVPSSRTEYLSTFTVANQPLYQVVARIQLPFGELVPTLRHSGIDIRNQVDPAAIDCFDSTVAGQRVLLIDDTWVSGGSSLSARASLLAAGAQSVGILVAARVIRPSYVESLGGAEYLAAAGALHDPDRWPRGE